MHALSALLLGEVLLGSRALFTRTELPFEIVHTLPGRLRAKVKGVKGSADKARELQHQVGALAGVKTSRADPRSGTLLLTFDDTDEVRKAIIDGLNAWTNADVGEPPPGDDLAPPRLRQQIKEAGQAANRSVLARTNGATDLQTMLALAAGAWGIKTIVSPAPIRRWQGMTLLYWSYNMLRR